MHQKTKSSTPVPALSDVLREWTDLETDRLSLEAQQQLLLSTLSPVQAEILLRGAFGVDGFAYTATRDALGHLYVQRHPLYRAEDGVAWGMLPPRPLAPKTDQGLAVSEIAVATEKAGWAEHHLTQHGVELKPANHDPRLRSVRLVITFDDSDFWYTDGDHSLTRRALCDADIYTPYEALAELFKLRVKDAAVTLTAAEIEFAGRLPLRVARFVHLAKEQASAESIEQLAPPSALSGPDRLAALLEHYRKERWNVEGTRASRVLHVDRRKVLLTLDFVKPDAGAVTVMAAGCYSTVHPFDMASDEPPTAEQAYRWIREAQPGFQKCGTPSPVAGVRPAPEHNAGPDTPAPLDDSDLDDLFPVSREVELIQRIHDTLRSKGWKRVGYQCGQYHYNELDSALGFCVLHVDSLVGREGYSWSADLRSEMDEETHLLDLDDEISTLDELPTPQQVWEQAQSLLEGMALARPTLS